MLALALPARGAITLAPPSADLPLTIRAAHGSHWRAGQQDVWLLQGPCRITQGTTEARGSQAVLWIEHHDLTTEVTVYLEGETSVRWPGANGVGEPRKWTAQQWLGHFQTSKPLALEIQARTEEPGSQSPLFQRAVAWRSSQRDFAVRPAQFLESDAGASAANFRRLIIRRRGNVGINAESSLSEDGQERITVLDSGINIIIENTGPGGVIDIVTDRMVIWSGAEDMPALGGESFQSQDAPLELYMEGNIIFRQGETVIFADRMYYNVQREQGLVLHGEMLTAVPGYPGLVRLKAEILQQLDAFRYQGINGALTTSRLGVPRYWIQSGSFVYQEVPRLGETSVVPESPFWQAEQNTVQKLATSRNNLLYLGQMPLFYWPFLATDLEKPTYYLESLRVNNDRIFGTQVLTDWNMYQIFGIQSPPPGTEWTGSLDYLSERGLGVGTNLRYDRSGMLGWPGRNYGFLDAWGINDQGLDNLGADRRRLEPEADFRGRVFGRHRHDLPNGFQLTAELGLISDRNFLEQYYEHEWDQEKDFTTGLELKQTIENQSWSITGDVRPNDFFTQTEWLPRLDHFWLGQPILGDYLTWYEHSHVGYGRLQVAEPPEDPAELRKFDPLAWEASREGLRAATRQEIDLPLDVGPVKVVPYLLGEAAYWQEDLSGEELSRTLGQMGIRTSLPLWQVDPTVQSLLLNLNGLAHKVVLDAELFWASADESFEQLPLYDPLDDDAIEFFRRRFFFDTFGGMAGGDVPLKFDERTYALRSGLQSWVTSPSTEVADDLALMRLGVRQRWQTKRGLPGRQRIVDWITFDLETLVYPRPDRDNFGQEVGLTSYDFRWHVGDRFTILSDGQADFFGDGLRTVSLSGVVSRPGRGRLLVGTRSIEGPISSSLLFGSASYRLSPKWILNYGTSLDLGGTGNIGQSGRIVRVGESFLVGLGFHFDDSRDNFGVRFAVEPRFLSSRLGNVAGVPIPPIGAMGLE